MQRVVFFISDSTGITAETLGRSLLTQFQELEFDQTTIPYVNTIEKAKEVLERINQASRDTKARVLVFSTLADPKIREILASCNCLFIDFFDAFIPPLEEELHSKYAKKIGELHKIANFKTYDQRVAAIEFALNTDDGVGINNYKNADIVLIGVSRCGKTPTSLYLALKFGLFAANYPITDENLTIATLPKDLEPHKDKLFGLTITAQRLHEIREQRKPKSTYASLPQCQRELSMVEKIFKRSNIPFLNSTTFSIEEIATKIMAMKKIKRQRF
jgi:regulator of PEP synthase PpsR (kinase-PPPase family)